jgi:hypothetical protein
MFESGAHINRLHLPIEIGDVFAKTDGNAAKRFILLGQPCGLMVRPNGARQPQMNQVLLGEVQVVEKSSRYDEIIPYFGDDPASKHCVRFKRIHSVPVIVLDLCVFNEDGVAHLPKVCPDRLTPAWAARPCTRFSFIVLRGAGIGHRAEHRPHLPPLQVMRHRVLECPSINFLVSAGNL